MSCCHVARPFSKGLWTTCRRNRRRCLSTMEFMVVAPPEREYSVRIGGSTLSSLSTFQLVSFFLSLAKFSSVASEFVVQPLHPDTVFPLCTHGLSFTHLPPRKRPTSQTDRQRERNPWLTPTKSWASHGSEEEEERHSRASHLACQILLTKTREDPTGGMNCRDARVV